jgi:hypothetical protein
MKPLFRTLATALISTSFLAPALSFAQGFDPIEDFARQGRVARRTA